ncbi:hypothetical protein F511_10137 [Dorcoceras hygrometricum]|uniref:Uncharacterized protein n=1 Tax=Dorcoceras hygrometricum TaxID=472368 RepID=A0A2Z7AIY2_9LAMI|nr:hypothetical protein F511_10137 [Dorcoceras hygrometricum]
MSACGTTDEERMGGDWYKASLPKIAAAAKGKAALQEKDPIKGNPAKEIFSLICADIELLVQLREQVIDDVDKFFNSFCLKRLAALKIEDIYEKEEQVLTWAETYSTRIALQRKMYILTKYRELLLRKFLEARKTNFVPGESTSAIDLKVLAMLSYLHLFVVNELKTKMQEHGLTWEMTCCSRLFEGPNHDRGTVIARSNENIRSSCWIRTMIRVEGSWVIEPCTDYWKPLPRRIIQNEICLRLLIALTVVEPAQHFAYRRPTVTTWGWSQLCTVFLRFSLFGGLQTVNFSILRSDVVSVRPVLGAASIFYTVVQFALVPSLADTAFDSDVQLDAFPSSDSDSDSSSSHDSMDIHVDTPVLFTTADALQGTDTVVDQSLLISTSPTTTVFTESFAQLQDSISQISINQVQTQRSLDDLKSELSVKLNEYQKGTHAHHALVTTELEDIQKEVKAMDEQLATIRSEMLEFRAQAQENHLNLSTQLGFLVDYINRGGDAKKGEGGSSRPQPPRDDQSRPSGGSGSRGSGGDGSSQRRDRGGSSKKRHSGGGHHSSGGGGPVGPIRRDAEYWISGKRQF